MEDGNGGGIVGLLFALVILAIIVVCIAGMWKLFEKAGKPGDASGAAKAFSLAARSRAAALAFSGTRFFSSSTAAAR